MYIIAIQLLLTKVQQIDTIESKLRIDTIESKLHWTYWLEITCI